MATETTGTTGNAAPGNQSFLLSGSMCGVFVDGRNIGVITNIGISTRRDIQPVWAMNWNPNVQGYFYNLRRVGIECEIAPFNGMGALGIYPQTEDYKVFKSPGESMYVVDTEGNEVFNTTEYENDEGTLEDVEVGGINFNSEGGVMPSFGIGGDGLRVGFDANTRMGASTRGPVANAELLNKLLESTGGVLTFQKGYIDYIDQGVALDITLVGFVQSIGQQHMMGITGCAFHTRVVQIGITQGQAESTSAHAFGSTKWVKQQASISANGQKVSYNYPTPGNRFPAYDDPPVKGGITGV